MMKGGINALMKQAQKMQEQMEKMREELNNIVIEGSAGGGLVKVRMNGKHEAVKVELDPSLFEEDRDMAADLIAAAINDASRKLEAATSEKMSEVAKKSGLPANFNLPF